MKKIPVPPTPLLSRMIIEGTVGTCPLCHSTETRKYFSYTLITFGKKIGCI